MNIPVVWVLPEVFLRGFFWEMAIVFSCIQLRLVRQWIHVLRWLVWFYGPSYLTVTCSWRHLRSTFSRSSGRRLPELFPFLALFGSTVDTFSASVYGCACSRLVSLVVLHLALFPFPWFEGP